jgi:hypothetical protein
MEGDQDGDGKLSFEEFAQMVSNTVWLYHSFLGGNKNGLLGVVVIRILLSK